MLSDMDGTEHAVKPRWGFIPQLERDQRRQLLGDFEQSGRWNVDFVIMMAMSTGLAALGLLNDSVAVVIGAMLVAPLMSPLIGAGFALVQGNLILFRDCLKAMSYGILVGLMVSLAIGLITPAYEPTAELEARANVNLLDLGVALLSGMAAAYALGRPKLMATLSGVAIAAALVPPLATVGISATSDRFLLAGLALVLFLTNLVAITAGAAIVYALMGAQGGKGEGRMPAWAQRVIMLLGLSAVVLIIPLSDRLDSQLNAGQAKALNYPLSPRVRQVVFDRVAPEWGVEVITMGRFSVDQGLGAQIILAAEAGVTATLISDIESGIRAIAGDSLPVRIFVLATAPGTHPEPPVMSAD